MEEAEPGLAQRVKKIVIVFFIVVFVIFVVFYVLGLALFLWNWLQCIWSNDHSDAVKVYVPYWNGGWPWQCICKSDFEGDKCQRHVSAPNPPPPSPGPAGGPPAPAGPGGPAGPAGPPPCPPPLISGNCGTQKSIDTCNGYTTSGAPSGQGYRCIWVTQKPGITTTHSCDSYIRGQETDRLCTIPAAVHRPCKEDSDCMSGRCSMGDPGCYAANTCSAPRLPTEGGPSYQMLQDTAVSRMQGWKCGRLLSASGNP